MSEPSGLFLPARAKLNLVLRITGRRADGYHLLETLFHAIELHDDVWMADAETTTLHVSAARPDLAVSAGEDNLVHRALVRFAAATGRRRGFDVQLHKRIPNGAGLGGGSSDAAAALVLANESSGRPLDDAALDALASGLGADVPFFLRGGSQWGRGIGDELEPASVPPMHFVLVVPPYGCPTAAVYENHAALWNSAAPQDTVRAVTGPHTRDSGLRIEFRNDLAVAAERVRPALGQLRQRIRQCIADLGPVDVAMTGSGSTLFLAFRTDDESAQCAARLRELSALGVRIERTRSAPAAADAPVRAARPGQRQS